MGYLVPIIMLLGLGIMAFFMMKGNKQQILWLKEIASQNGWSSKTKSEGAIGVYQIIGTSQEGLRWELNAYSRSSSEDRNVILHPSREYTELLCTISNHEGELLVMPRDLSWKSFSDQQILGFIKPVWVAMGLPADNFVAYSNIREDIQKMYMIYTTKLEFAKSILPDELLQELVKWSEVIGKKGSLVNIRISPKELSLQVGYLINSPKEVKGLITIGERMSRGL